jgi:hypothetical protein
MALRKYVHGIMPAEKSWIASTGTTSFETESTGDVGATLFQHVIDFVGRTLEDSVSNAFSSVIILIIRLLTQGVEEYDMLSFAEQRDRSCSNFDQHILPLEEITLPERAIKTFVDS